MVNLTTTHKLDAERDIRQSFKRKRAFIGMKNLLRWFTFAIVLVGLFAGLITAFVEMRKEREQDATAETPVTAPSLLEPGPGGSYFLKLDAETQQRLGVKVAQPVKGSVKRQVTGVAEVLDGTLLAGQLNEIRAAEISLEASRLDFQRKKKLFEDGQNAPASAVEASEAALKQCKIALQAARDRLVAVWGPVLAEREDMESLARGLLERNVALLRVEFPAAARLLEMPQTIHFKRQNGDELPPGQLLGPALKSGPAMAMGPMFLAIVRTNASSLVPGLVVIAQADAGVEETGFIIPREAVVRRGGVGWVYVQTNGTAFLRREIPLNRPHPDGWLVSGEWENPVVVSGAQSLLSEEFKQSIMMLK